MEIEETSLKRRKYSVLMTPDFPMTPFQTMNPDELAILEREVNSFENIDTDKVDIDEMLSDVPELDSKTQLHLEDEIDDDEQPNLAPKTSLAAPRPRPMPPLFTLEVPIRRLTKEQRKERIARFVAKRAHRVWAKEIKYNCRKEFAESRPRVRGRFIPKVQGSALQKLKEQELMNRFKVKIKMKMNSDQEVFLKSKKKPILINWESETQIYQRKHHETHIYCLTYQDETQILDAIHRHDPQEIFPTNQTVKEEVIDLTAQQQIESNLENPSPSSATLNLVDLPIQENPVSDSSMISIASVNLTSLISPPNEAPSPSSSTSMSRNIEIGV